MSRINHAVKRFRSHQRWSVAGSVIAMLVLALAGCDSGTKSDGEGNATDAAFTRDMIPHHRGAIEMAEYAQKRAEHDEVKELAKAIIDAQRAEISLMTRIGEELRAHGAKAGSLGMSHVRMGMDMGMPMLARAKSFDRAFIDMMIPHHRGAVAMARIELEKGTHAELRKLARSVIDDQNAEIKRMQTWRMKWYGAELPESTSGAMDHGMM